jgi:hypothetical protein
MVGNTRHITAVREASDMKYYFFHYSLLLETDESETEYFTSIAKLKKARAGYKRRGYGWIGLTIFTTTVKPTKKGILRALNGQGGDIVEGGE